MPSQLIELSDEDADRATRLGMYTREFLDMPPDLSGLVSLLLRYAEADPNAWEQYLRQFMPR